MSALPRPGPAEPRPVQPMPVEPMPVEPMPVQPMPAEPRPVVPPPDQPGPVEVGQFRRAVGRFATGVCVVTTFADRHDHAMTANAFTSVSLDPRLVLVCVEQDARFHDAVLDAGCWGVSVLDHSARPEAEWLATPGRPLIGQLDTVPHHRGAATGVALLDHSLATMECLTEDVHPAGDHSIVVGRVIRVELADDVLPPLVYHRSTYRTLR